MLTEKCSAADKPLDFELQKSYREVMPLNIRAHLAQASKTKFGHDSAFSLPVDAGFGLSHYGGGG